MTRLLSLIRPFRYDGIQSVAFVETGPGDQVPEILAHLRGLFASARIEVLLREEDEDRAAGLDADLVRVVRFEERAALVSELKQQHFDIVVMQLGRGGAQGLRSLPFVLRGKSILVFNESLDYFPLNLFRIGDVARHFGLVSEGLGLLTAPVVIGYLLVATWRIRLRGWWRRGVWTRPGADFAPEGSEGEGGSSASPGR